MPPRNGDSVLIVFAFAGMASGRCFETDRVQQFVQVVDDALIEPIEVRTLRIWQRRVSRKRMEQACGQRGVNAFKEFEKDDRDRVPGRAIPSAAVRSTAARSHVR